MATIDTIATDYQMQPYEIAAALGLGTNYRETAELDEATEAEYREILDIMVEQADVE